MLRLMQWCLLCLISLGASSINATVISAGEHASFSIFFNEGAKPFPDTITGKHIEEAMRKQGFDLMMLSQSAGLHNDDVWSVQNNTLRHEKGELHDFGVGCNLIMKVNPVKASGICNVYMGGAGEDAHAKSAHVVLPVDIVNEDVWYKVFEDEKHGIAGYVTHHVSDLFYQ